MHLYEDKTEKAVLGSALLEANFVIDLLHREGISEDYFALPANKLVFKTLNDLAAEGKHIDILTVSNRLQESGHQECAGAYLDSLVDGTPVVEHIEGYIAELRKWYLRRRTWEVANVSANMAENPECDIQQMVEYIQRESMTLSDCGATPDKFQSIANVIKSWREAQKGGCIGIPSPWQRFDAKTGGPRRGQVTLLASKKGWGKSSLVANWLLHLGKIGMPAADLAFEDGAEITWGRIIGNYGSLSPWRLSIGQGSDEQINVAEEHGKIVAGFPIYIDGRRGMTVDAVGAWAARAVKKWGIQVLFVDGFKDIRRQSKDDLVEDARISSRLCDIAERLKIAVVVVHHVRKAGGEDTEGRPRPFTPEDIRGNGRIVDDARMVLILQVEPYRLECIRSNNSPTGYVELEFNGPLYRFTEKPLEPEVAGEQNAGRQEWWRGVNSAAAGQG